MKKGIKRVLTILLAAFLLLSLLPYLFPLSDAKLSPIPTPYAESQYREVDGLDLHYRIFTPDHTPKGKLLFIHGLGGSTFSWRENMTFFQDEGYLVIAVDLPGFGYSSKASGINHSQARRSQMIWSLLDLVDEDLDELTTNLQWTLLGHSMGGGTATAMAIDRPSDTKSLVLVDGAVFENQPSSVSALLAYAPLARGVAVIFDRILLSAKRIDSFLTSAYGRPATLEEIDGYLTPLKEPGTPKVALDLVKTSKNVPVEGVQNNDVPILALWGQEDTWVPLSDAEKIQDLIPRTEIVSISGAYHCPMETHSELFNDELLMFLEKTQ